MGEGGPRPRPGQVTAARPHTEGLGRTGPAPPIARAVTMTAAWEHGVPRPSSRNGPQGPLALSSMSQVPRKGRRPGNEELGPKLWTLSVRKELTRSFSEGCFPSSQSGPGPAGSRRDGPVSWPAGSPECRV